MWLTESLPPVYLLNGKHHTALAKERQWLPCFRQDEYREWDRFARLSGPLAPYTPCQDCLPEYQAEQLDIGRCLHPETQFVVFAEQLPGEPDYEIVGVRQITPGIRRRMVS